MELLQDHPQALQLYSQLKDLVKVLDKYDIHASPEIIAQDLCTEFDCSTFDVDVESDEFGYYVELQNFNWCLNQLTSGFDFFSSPIYDEDAPQISMSLNSFDHAQDTRLTTAKKSISLWVNPHTEDTGLPLLLPPITITRNNITLWLNLHRVFTYFVQMENDKD